MHGTRVTMPPANWGGRGEEVVSEEKTGWQMPKVGGPKWHGGCPSLSVLDSLNEPQGKLRKEFFDNSTRLGASSRLKSLSGISSPLWFRRSMRIRLKARKYHSQNYFSGCRETIFSLMRALSGKLGRVDLVAAVLRKVDTSVCFRAGSPDKSNRGRLIAAANP
jgi:hypothetical protein